MHTSSLIQNIWKYTVILVTSKRVFVAILSAYYLTFPNSTAATIGTILLAGNLAGFLFEIPSGYIADKFGHRRTLIMGRACMAVSSLLLLFASNTWWLIIGSVMMSISNAFQSGTGSAFMHDTLRALGKESEYARIMGRSSAIGFAIPIVFTALLPFLTSISFRIPFLVALLLDIIGLLAAYLLVSPPIASEGVKEVNARNFKSVLLEAHSLHYLGIAIFFGVVGGAVFALGGFRAAYQMELGVPVIWFGVLHSIGRVLASLFLAHSGRIKAYLTLPMFLITQIIFHGVIFILLGITSTWSAVVSLFIVSNAFYWGFSKIEENLQMQIIRNSKFKATLLSINAQVGQIIATIFGFGLGVVIEISSYKIGFLLMGIATIAILSPLWWRIRNHYKKGIYSLESF